MNKYRVDQYGSVYLFSAQDRAYIFIGKLNGLTLKQFIIEYENQE